MFQQYHRAVLPAKVCSSMFHCDKPGTSPNDTSKQHTDMWHTAHLHCFNRCQSMLLNWQGKQTGTALFSQTHVDVTSDINHLHLEMLAHFLSVLIQLWQDNAVKGIFPRWSVTNWPPCHATDYSSFHYICPVWAVRARARAHTRTHAHTYLATMQVMRLRRLKTIIWSEDLGAIVTLAITASFVPLCFHQTQVLTKRIHGQLTPCQSVDIWTRWYKDTGNIWEDCMLS